MIKLTLEIDKKIVSIEFPYSDITSDELLEGFCSLLIGQTFSPISIKNSLYRQFEEFNKILKLDEN